MNTKEWDIFDILFAHEDSYTNLLQYLFENSGEFYKNFSKLLFGKEKSNLKFVTRTSYDLGEGKRNVPDIIVFNDDNFAMIEVKVHSGEGTNQTQRYFDCKEGVKQKLGVSSNALNKFYYLTLLGTKAACSEFESISWLKIGECLPAENFETEEMELLVKHFKRRIDSLKSKPINLNDKWCDAVKTRYWGGAIGLFDALRMVPAFKQLPSEMCDYWGSFKKTKSTFTYSALFLLNSMWKGCSITDEKQNFRNCYELHFEFEWDEENGLLEIRLDYHLNPYLSNNDIKGLREDFQQNAIEANEYRKSVAQKAKQQWLKYAPKGTEKCYNSHLTDNIMKLLFKTIKIDKETTILQVVAQVQEFVSAASNFVEKEILQYHI